MLRLLGPVGEVLPGVQGVRVLRAEDPLVQGQQLGEQIPGGGGIPCLPGPVGEAGAGVQGTRVLRAEDPLADGQQRGELVTGPGRIPASPVQRANSSREASGDGCSGPGRRIVRRTAPRGVSRFGGQAGPRLPAIRPNHRKTTEAGPGPEALPTSSLPTMSQHVERPSRRSACAEQPLRLAPRL
jgi:hypothetical protein